MKQPRRNCIAVVLTVVLLAACSGTVQTTQGPRPATVVVAQDSIADVLKALRDQYRAAVKRHDGPEGAAEPTELHAKHRAVLLKAKPVLETTWDGLIAWKEGAPGASPEVVVRDSSAALLALVDLLEETGRLSHDAAAKTRSILTRFFAAPAPSS